MVKSARPPSTVKVRNGCPTAASTTASQTQMLVATTTPSQAPSRSESCLRAIERPPSYGEPPSFCRSSVSTRATRMSASNGFVTKRSAPRATACPPTSIAPALLTPDIATIFTAGHSRRSRPIVWSPPCPGMKMSTITTSAARRSYARIPASPSAACRTSWPACSRCFVRAWRSVTSSSMIKSRAMSPDSSLRQQSLGEVHALLELAEPALHLVERLRETRDIGLGESPPGALVRASDQPSHHDLRACDHADDERGADGPARNGPHAPPPARLLRRKEAPVGIEPTNRGFADLCLTTWLRRRGPRKSLEHYAFSTHRDQGLVRTRQLGALLGALSWHSGRPKVRPRCCRPSLSLAIQLAGKARRDFGSILRKVGLGCVFHVPEGHSRSRMTQQLL